MELRSWLLLIHIYVGIATLVDVPSLNGPIPIVPATDGSKRRPSDFLHPGLWHSHKDLETIRTNVQKGMEPWASTFARFANDSYSLASYQIKGPFPIISRGSVSNYTTFASDARAAYQNAIMWYVTRDQAHWDKRLDGDMFVNAAEIMRWEGGWIESGAKWQGGSGLSVQLYRLFARQSVIIGQANYGIASIKALLDFAVYLDDVSMYNYALYAFKNDLCAGIEATIHPQTGQNSESGRDQAHAMVGLGWLALAARTIKNQGYDVLKETKNLLIKGSEYVAAFNLNQTVPYDPKFYRCEAVLVNGPWETISNEKKGIGAFPSAGSTLSPAVWDILYYTASSRGIVAPWTGKAKATFDTAGGEGRMTGNDMPSWGDLLWATAGSRP